MVWVLAVAALLAAIVVYDVTQRSHAEYRVGKTLQEAIKDQHVIIEPNSPSTVSDRGDG
jgi:hypothetical protein